MKAVKILIVSDSAVIATGMAEVVRRMMYSVIAVFPEKYQIKQVGLHHCYAIEQPKWEIVPTKTATVNESRAWLTTDVYGQETTLEVLNESWLRTKSLWERVGGSVGRVRV